MSKPPADSFIDPPTSPGSAPLGELASRARARALSLALAALEHLLQQQTWARDRLRPHAGRVLRVAFDRAGAQTLSSPGLLARVGPSGLLQAAPPGTSADASLLIDPGPALLASVLRDGAQGLRAHVRIEGDALFAATLGELAEHLRWDAEEDLSRVVGDVAAHRLARLASQGLEALRVLGERSGSAGTQFLGAPQGPLAGGAQFEDQRVQARALERRVQALERRVARLAQGRVLSPGRSNAGSGA